MSRLSHSEVHMVHRIGWLRAAVLGANDGLVSTSSLVVGVAAAGSGATEILIAGFAGLVAGAMSMAAGEYVSVSSQTDAENADLARERRELAETPEAELEELTGSISSAASIAISRARLPPSLRQGTRWPPTPATNLASLKPWPRGRSRQRWCLH